MYEVFGTFIDKFVFPCWSGEYKQETVIEGRTCNIKVVEGDLILQKIQSQI